MLVYFGLQSELHSSPSIDLSMLFHDLRPRGLSTSVSSYRPDSFHALDRAMKAIEDRKKIVPNKFSSIRQDLSHIQSTDNRSIFSSNIDSLNLNLLRVLSQSHGITVPLSSQLCTLLDELVVFSNNSTQRNDSTLLPNQVALLLGNNPPLKTKSRFYNVTEISNKIKRLAGLGLTVKIYHYHKSNCFDASPSC